MNHLWYVHEPCLDINLNYKEHLIGVKGEHQDFYWDKWSDELVWVQSGRGYEDGLNLGWASPAAKSHVSQGERRDRVLLLRDLDVLHRHEAHNSSLSISLRTDFFFHLICFIFAFHVSFLPWQSLADLHFVSAWCCCCPGVWVLPAVMLTTPALITPALTTPALTTPAHQAAIMRTRPARVTMMPTVDMIADTEGGPSPPCRS